MSKSLPIPDVVTSNERAVEIARVWAASNEQNVTIDVGTMDHPSDWGFLVANLARHTAIAYGQEGKISFEDALESIKQRMDVEWDRSFGQ